MKIRDLFVKISAAAVVCAMLALPCGCGEEEKDSGSDMPFTPAVSAADVSGSDIGFADNETGPVYTIYKGAEAIDLRDLDAYMSTIDPDSEVYDITREDTKYMFAHYRLAVSIDNVEIKSLDDDSAVVSVTQTTLPVAEAEPVSASDISSSDVSGSDVSTSDVPAPLSGKDYTSKFTPCVTVLTHTMRNIDGSWYITSTVVESYREISTQWDLLGDISAADPQSLVLSGNLPVSPSDSVSSADAE